MFLKQMYLKLIGFNAVKSVYINVFNAVNDLSNLTFDGIKQFFFK